MRILVTGGGGYLGSIVVRGLLSHGHEVRVLDSLRYGAGGIAGLDAQERFQFVQGDIRTAAVVENALEGVEAVIHLAALVGDPACAREADLARQVNEEASMQLLGLSRSRGIQRFIFASTCSNYGRMSNGSQFLTEDSDLQPISLYAQTKVAVERFLLDSSYNHGPAATILRFATLFGLSPRMRFDLTVNEFTMEFMVRRRVTLYGEQFWRPYLHVRDAAQAVRLVLESPIEKVGGQAFNVGETGQNYQKGKLVELIRRQIGDSVRIERVAKEEDPRDYRVSFEKIKRELGFSILRPLEAGVREIVAAISLGLFTNLDDPIYRN